MSFYHIITLRPRSSGTRNAKTPRPKAAKTSTQQANTQSSQNKQANKTSTQNKANKQKHTLRSI
jgi:hypothetical protein